MPNDETEEWLRRVRAVARAAEPQPTPVDQGWDDAMPSTQECNQVFAMVEPVFNPSFDWMNYVHSVAAKQLYPLFAIAQLKGLAVVDADALTYIARANYISLYPNTADSMDLMGDIEAQDFQSIIDYLVLIACD